MSEATWRALAERAMGGRSLASLESVTFEGLRLQPLYPRETRALPLALRQRDGAWAIAQRVDHPGSAEANRLALLDLEGGADALTLVFAGETGRGYGMPLLPEALTAALDGVELDLITVRVDAGERALEAMRLLGQLTVARRLASAALPVDLGLDPLGALARTGRPAAGLSAQDVRLLRDESATAGLAGALFLADGRPYHEAGAGEAQELAAVLATGVAYLRLLEHAGSDPAEAPAGLAFLLVADADITLTLAKFRALRRLWARVEEACGWPPRPIRLHAETAWRMMTRRDPWTNVMRTTAATFAAGVGGADVVTVLPFTAALGLPEDRARRLARTMQIMLQSEAQVSAVDDPAAGSGGFEAATEALCDQAWALFREIEAEGGMEASLLSGALRARVAATAARRHLALATASRGITGTSTFPARSEPGLPLALASRTRDPQPGPLALPGKRDAEPFEALRDRADAAATGTGARPAIGLAALGTPAQYGASATHAANVFAAGGFDTCLVDVSHYDSSIWPIVCLCAASSTAVEEVETAAASMCRAGARMIMAVGEPRCPTDRTTGIDRFIHRGVDLVQLLGDVLDRLGAEGLPAALASPPGSAL